MINLKNVNVVLTGATGGIGNSILEKLVDAEANVVATGTNEEKLIAIKNKYQSVKVEKFDISKHNEIENFINKVTTKLENKIDILINNAGITGPIAELWNYSINDWNKVVEINLNGTFNCCKSIVPNMIKNNYGRIVNISSVAGKDGNANASAYSSAKAGVLALTKALGKELAEKNIAVNAVTPAGAKTRILDQMTDKHVKFMLSKVPRGRFLELEELSSLVCWLSSEENSFSTAAVFDISGGRSTY